MMRSANARRPSFAIAELKAATEGWWRDRGDGTKDRVELISILIYRVVIDFILFCFGVSIFVIFFIPEPILRRVSVVLFISACATAFAPESVIRLS